MAVISISGDSRSMADHKEAGSIGELSRQMNKFEERLFGNGQPGILKQMDDRIDTVEGKWDMVAGAGLVISLCLTAFEIYMHYGHK